MRERFCFLFVLFFITSLINANEFDIDALNKIDQISNPGDDAVIYLWDKNYTLEIEYDEHIVGNYLIQQTYLSPLTIEKEKKIIKILSHNGLMKYCNVEDLYVKNIFGFDLKGKYSVKVKVLKKTGKVVTVKPKIHEVDTTLNLAKIVKVSFAIPDVQIGDTVLIEKTIKSLNKIDYRDFPMMSDDYIRFASFQLNIPDDIDINPINYNLMPYTFKINKNKRGFSYRWELKDIPGTKSEKMTFSDEECFKVGYKVRRFQNKTIPTWARFIKMYDNIRIENALYEDELQLTKKNVIVNSREDVELLFNDIKQSLINSVRFYPEDTEENKKDNKEALDRIVAKSAAILFLTLKNNNIPVFISRTRPNNIAYFIEDDPDWTQFDEEIIVIKLENNYLFFHFSDSGDYSLPRNIQGSQSIVIDDTIVTFLKNPINSESAIERTLTVRFSNEDSITVNLNFQAHDLWATVLSDLWIKDNKIASSIDTELFLKNEYLKGHQLLRVQGENNDRIGITIPLNYETKLSVIDKFIAIPFDMDYLDLLISHLDTTKRYNDIDLTMPSKIKINFVLEKEDIANYLQSYPKSISFSFDKYAYAEVNNYLEKDSIKTELMINYKNARIPASKHREFVEFIKTIRSHLATNYVIKKD